MTLSKIDSDLIATGVEAADTTAFAFDETSDKMLKKVAAINQNKENFNTAQHTQYVEVPETKYI